MKYKLPALAILTCGALLMSFQVHANEKNDGEQDIKLAGSLLEIDKATDKYKIKVQWDVTNLSQWTRVLESFKTLPEAEEFYNPILVKDPEVITIVQTNPDHISGETAYFSKQGFILRIERTPVDIHFKKAGDFYSFLTDEIRNNDAEFTPEKKNIPVDEAEIVVVFRGNTSLGNPSWTIKDPERVDLYKQFIAQMTPVKTTKNMLRSFSSQDVDFNQLNTFLVYTNFPGAQGKMIIVHEDGVARWTKISQTAHCYLDEKKFYDSFLAFAHEVIKNNEESEKKKRQGNLETNF